MTVLKQTAGFIIFAVAIEAVWVLLSVDILEDLNIFGEARCWPWLIGAVVLFAGLAVTTRRIGRPAVRNGAAFGVLAALLGIGLLVPRLIGGDGLAVGMLGFINAYWILTVAAYWGLLLVGRRLASRRNARQPPGSDC